MKIEREARNRTVVLLSGGLDSTVALASVAASNRAYAALFFDYEQHAARREEEAARRIADRYGLSFEMISLPWLARISGSALIRGKGEPPRWSSERLADTGAREVWVENRNGIFIAIAALYAAEAACDAVIVGFNADEARAFPDNGVEYLARINGALELGVRARVRVESPTIRMTKREIVSRAIDLDIPWEFLWSCYGGAPRMCGSCESCLRLKGALAGTPAEPRVQFEKERV